MPRTTNAAMTVGGLDFLAQLPALVLKNWINDQEWAAEMRKRTKCGTLCKHAVTPKNSDAFANPLDSAELPSRFKESENDVYTFSGRQCNPIFS
jgi:hypothetical protein